MKKKALITGITGQDGAYLAEFLLNKDYEVHGIKRMSSLFNTMRVDHLYQDPHEKELRFKLHNGDLSDASNLTRIIQEVKPDEIYNLGAMSHVKVSFEEPEYSANVDGIGTLRILEAVRLLGMAEKTRIYQASTSELFGKVQEMPQTENTPFYPRSPYAAAKLYAYWIIVNYREAYNMFAVNGILFNHESPIRGETFVTRKITRAASRIILGLQKTFYLGNLDAKRDWGHAKDYVEAMWKMLQVDTPYDLVIATGTTTSIRDFVSMVFNKLGISLRFDGKGINEKAIVEHINQDALLKLNIPQTPLQKGDTILQVDPRYFRPTEVDILKGDSSKAHEVLNWKPKYDLESLVEEMTFADLELMKQDKLLIDSGYGQQNNHE